MKMKRIKAFDRETHKSFRILNRSGKQGEEIFSGKRRELPRLQKLND